MHIKKVKTIFPVCLVSDCLNLRNERSPFCELHVNKHKKPAACRVIYFHEKAMAHDPEALTTEFLEKTMGVHCKRLEKEKKEG